MQKVRIGYAVASKVGKWHGVMKIDGDSDIAVSQAFDTEEAAVCFNAESASKAAMRAINEGFSVEIYHATKEDLRAR